MAGQMTISVIENNGRAGKVTISCLSTITAGQGVALGNAIKTLSLGKVQTPQVSAPIAGFTPETGAAPETAQRGQKLVFIGVAANTQQTHKCEIPCADSSYIATPGSDNVDLLDPDIATFVTALQAVWRDASDNAITVTKAYYANRNVQ